MSKAAEPASVQMLYTELNKYIRISDYKQVLKTCNKIIHSKDGKQETEAMMCKVVCFIEMNQFAEALKFIAATPEIQEHSIFEKAYCHYRLQKIDEALQTIDEAEDIDLRTLELQAQILYKLGRYSECLPIYKKLMKECSDDMEDDRMTNYIAVNAALAMFENAKTNVKFEPTTYDQYYNAGCIKLGEDKPQEANELFQKAEELCRKMLTDDPEGYTEEEIEADVACIRVQLAFTLQLLGKEDEALSIYNQIIRSRPSDVALLAVASNNIITINRDQNVFDSRKRMKATVANGVDKKLTPHQKKDIDINRALLFMYSNQWDACKQLLKTMKSKYDGEEIPYLIQAAMLCREKNLTEAITFLKNYMESRSDTEIYGHLDMSNVKLALIQMMLQNDQITEACRLLESMEDICYKPAMVSLLVVLYKRSNENNDTISNLFERAIEWNRLNKENNESLTVLMWKFALFNIDNRNNKKAAEVLEQMLTRDENNVKVMAQLIFAYSQLNPDRAHQISERLPRLSAEVNVDELEANASAPRYIKRQKEKKSAAADAEAAAGDAATNKKQDSNVVSERSQQMLKTKKKKKKKNPTPKNFQADYVPDPERWVPLRERTTYKGRRKDKRKGVMKGSQGLASSSAAADQYDMSNKAATSSNSATSQQTASSNQPGTSGTQPSTSKPSALSSRNNKNKKKKKGKGRW